MEIKKLKPWLILAGILIVAAIISGYLNKESNGSVLIKADKYSIIENKPLAIAEDNANRMLLIEMMGHEIETMKPNSGNRALLRLTKVDNTITETLKQEYIGSGEIIEVNFGGQKIKITLKGVYIIGQGNTKIATADIAAEYFSAEGN